MPECFKTEKMAPMGRDLCPVEDRKRLTMILVKLHVDISVNIFGVSSAPESVTYKVAKQFI